MLLLIVLLISVVTGVVSDVAASAVIAGVGDTSDGVDGSAVGVVSACVAGVSVAPPAGRQRVPYPVTGAVNKTGGRHTHQICAHSHKGM